MSKEKPGDKVELPYWAVEAWFGAYQVNIKQAVIDWEDMSQGKLFLSWGPADGDNRGVVLREEDNILTVHETISETVLSTRVATVRGHHGNMALSKVTDDFSVRTGRDREILLVDLLACHRSRHPALAWLDECRVLGIMSAEETEDLSKRIREEIEGNEELFAV